MYKTKSCLLEKYETRKRLHPILCDQKLFMEILISHESTTPHFVKGTNFRRFND